MIQEGLIENLLEWEKKCKEGILCENCKVQKDAFPPGGNMKIERKGIRGEMKKGKSLFLLGTGRGMFNISKNSYS